MLDTVSFCVHSGEFIGLIGPNGAGKTTLLNVILGLLTTQSGAVERTQAVGYVPQRTRVDDQIPVSVGEIVGLTASSKAAVQTYLKKVGMNNYRKTRFSELSGGQQQRVLIAKALAAKAELLILDEPTTGVDEASSKEFYSLLASLRKQGVAIVMVSHDIDAVLRQVTRVVCLNERILYDGDPARFEADRHMPAFYNEQHQLLHHQHGEHHA